MTVDILEKGQSFTLPLLLEASAGTGKTFFISHFVIRSLLEGIRLDQIAAITFTKKAASELKERIFSLIDEALDALVLKQAPFGYLEPYLEDPALYHKGIERLIEAKGAIPQAIGTIHHFASLLLSQYSSKALTISPDLIVPFAKIARERLEEASPLPYLKALLSLSLKQEKGWERWIKALFEKKKSPFAHDDFLKTRDERLRKHGSCLAPLLEEETLKAWISTFKGGKSLFKKARDLSQDLTRAFHGELLFPDLLDLYPEIFELEEKKKKSSSVLSPIVQSFLEEELLPYFREITTRDFLLGFFHEMVEPIWDRYRKEEALFGFDDLLEEVARLIKTDLFKKRILEAYPLLIVDEFQDTDPVQWHIIKELYLQEENGKGLLLVGDPKQSIYGFRKADLHTYLEAASHPKLSRLTLRSNFRSAPILLHSLNALLNSPHSQSWSWIPQKESLIEVPVLQAKSSKIIPPDLGAAIEIGVCTRKATRERTFPGAQWESEIGFPYIIQEIKKLSSSVPLGEICILIEDRYQGFRLKAALEKAYIPALIDRSVDVRECSELFALIKLLFQAIDHPESTSRILSLLLSPFFQADPQIHSSPLLIEAQVQCRILKERFASNQGLFFATLFKEPLFTGGRSLEEGISLFDDLLYEGATRGCWVILEKLIAIGMTEAIHTAGSFADLLDQWQGSFHSQDEWNIPKKENLHAVKMMTCFAAKGLEFDVVFALNLTTREALETKSDRAQREEEIAEKMRQLYVAITRSRLKLYLPFAFESPMKLGHFTPSPLELFFAQMLEGTIDLKTAMTKADELSLAKLEKIISLLTIEGASLSLKKIDAVSLDSPDLGDLQSSITDEETLQEKTVFNASSDALRPIEDLSFTSLRKWVETNPYRTLDLPKTPFPSGKEIGDLIHRLFEELFSKGLFRESKKGERFHFIKSLITSTPLASHLDPLIEMVERWLHKPLFDGTSLESLNLDQVQTEMDFIFNIFDENAQSNTIRGSIDLCVVIHSKVWILDWKTHLLDPNTSKEKLQEFVIDEGYTLQAKIYALGLQQWLHLFPKPLHLQPILFCFLHCKEPVEVTIELDQKSAIERELFLIDAQKGRSLHE